MSEETNPAERNASIDCLRIFSALFVIVNHTIEELFLSYTTPADKTWWVSLIWFWMSKTAVPVFVMISGYLLLNRRDSFKKSVERIARTVLVIVLFSGVYYLNNCYRDPSQVIRVWGFLRSIWGNSITNAYWYLYMYLGLMVMLPILQILSQAMDANAYKYLFLCYAVLVGGIPFLANFVPELTMHSNFNIPIFNVAVVLFMAGGYFRRYGFMKKWVCLAGYILTLALNVVMSYTMQVRDGDGAFMTLDNYQWLPLILEGFFIFQLLMQVPIEGRLGKVISWAGAQTFGIYLLSDLLIVYTRFIFDHLYEAGVHLFISRLLWEVSIFMIGLAITAILRLIPPMKRLI